MKVQRESRTGPSPQPGTPAWLAGCRAGEPDAIATMFAEHCAAVERVIARLIGPSADLEDMVQTTFLEALRNLSRYRGEASFKTWLTSVAIHVAQHHLRAGRVRRHEPLELVPEDRFASSHPEVESRLDERRLSARVHDLLDKIPPQQRVALLLFAVEGLSVEEVAALMKASQTATRSRVFFARRALRGLIEADPRVAAMAAALFGPGQGEEPR